MTYHPKTSHWLSFGIALLLSAPSLSAQATPQELTRFAGDIAGGQLGTTAYVGDVNGDGVPEFAVAAAHRDHSSKLNTGRVQLIDGATFSVLWSVLDDTPHAQLGTSLAGLHDADGDGVPDLAAGAPGADGSGQTGRVLILSGVDGSVLKVLTGTQAGGRFGASLAALHDLDSDGHAEIVIGAPGEDTGDLNTGSAYVIDPISGVIFNSFSGVESGDGLGTSVSGSGSLVANMQVMFHDDPIPTIGCTPGSSLSLGAPQEASGGNGYVMLVDPLTAEIHATETGKDAFDRFGSSSVSVGDLDGDGIPELFVGSDPRNSANHATGEGYTRLLTGSGVLKNEREGTEIGNNYGVAVVGTGDVDGDGIPDYLVGESRDDTAGTDAGRIVLHSGADHSELAQVLGEQSGEQFGSLVSAVGDLNGDGLAEFAAAAPQHDGQRGELRVFTLTPWSKVGGGVPGSTGVAQLSGRGGVLGGHDIQLVLSGAPAFADARIVYGSTLLTDTDGKPLPSSDVIVSGLSTDANGELTHRITWPSGMPSGVTTWFQVILDDESVSGGESSSTVIGGTTP
ncbi:MAG: hypothetical protein DHS20C15_29270 [Planctomycetota bacterium]|nr:MAG: hypothetical protein DHS20C15_29270 [Planctomycetota bacterium]